MRPYILACLACLVSPGLAANEAPRFSIELELGSTWQEKNDVQIPNDREGDRFSLTEVAGSGPWASARVNFNWDIRGPHGLRVVLAPLSYSERGRLDEDTRFADESFSADDTVKASYRFNSWRVGYRYRFYEKNDWRLWVGGTLKVRDAEIELKQAGVSADDDDLGVVPLLYFAGEYRFNDRWLFQFDFDGLAGGPGRAIDLGLKLGYELNDRWRVSAGYRGLEGGVDSDDVYNFAWFNTALVAVDYRW
ncbi:MAG: hypothetical protein AAGI11_02770 [Pseudomonadota bacterium]